jgi:predicted nucleic acid-binding protein
LSQTVVVDSGILIASVFPETFTAKALAILSDWRRQGIQLVAPTLFRYEIVAVTRKIVYQARAMPEQALRGRDEMLNYAVAYQMDDSLLKRAYDLATQLKRPSAYDSQYLALAERLGCEFWTADERLFNAVNGTIPYIRWLANY